MATDIKFKKNWEGEEQHTSDFRDGASAPLEDEITSYNFLRNIWGNYFYNRQTVGSEDQVDSINKIVGMMKAQIKLMILSETKQRTGEQRLNEDFVKETETYKSLRAEMTEVKEKLERSKTKEEQMSSLMGQKDRQLKKMEQENNRLKAQVYELKQARNKANEQIIMLSSRCYQLQRLNTVPSHSFLDQFSANSMENESQNQERPRVSLFGRKNSKILQSLCEDTASVHSEEEVVEQKVELQEINMNIPAKSKNPMKQSLQCNYKEEVSQESYSRFLQEMKLVKLRTERIIEMANEKGYQRGGYRKTLQPYTDRPYFKEMASPISILKDKRFKRIR